MNAIQQCVTVIQPTYYKCMYNCFCSLYGHEFSDFPDEADLIDADSETMVKIT